MFSEKDLSNLIGEVEKEFSSYLAKAEQAPLAKSEEVTLEKAEDEKEKEEKKEDKPEAQAEQKEEAPQESKEAAPEQKEEMPDAQAEAKPEDAQASGDAAAQGEDHGYDDEDMEHMHSMYSSMSKGELKAHHDAVRKALDAQMASQQNEGMQEQAPMIKSEETQVIEVKPEIVQPTADTELLKSEVAVKSAKIEELQKTLDAVTAFVTKLVEKKGAPQGKAITQLDVIAKTESTEEVKTLNKNEITEKLNKKASDSTLNKSDREAINQYYATGQINTNGISHLLK